MTMKMQLLLRNLHLGFMQIRTKIIIGVRITVQK